VIARAFIFIPISSRQIGGRFFVPAVFDEEEDIGKKTDMQQKSGIKPNNVDELRESDLKESPGGMIRPGRERGNKVVIVIPLHNCGCNRNCCLSALKSQNLVSARRFPAR
jgi:hypothetical protein